MLWMLALALRQVISLDRTPLVIILVSIQPARCTAMVSARPPVALLAIRHSCIYRPSSPDIVEFAVHHLSMPTTSFHILCWIGCISVPMIGWKPSLMALKVSRRPPVAIIAIEYLSTVKSRSWSWLLSRASSMLRSFLQLASSGAFLLPFNLVIYCPIN